MLPSASGSWERFRSPSVNLGSSPIKTRIISSSARGAHHLYIRLTMVDTDVSSLGGMLSFGLGSRRGTARVDIPDGVSVISNASTKGSLFGKTITVEDESSSDDEDDAGNYPHEFVIQCKDDETVFVTAWQGKKALGRCAHLRELVVASSDNGNGQIVHQPSWSVSNVRRVIEVLTMGSTWIENDVAAFEEFQKIAKELWIDIRLTSLINYQDMLTNSTTDMFFKMMHFENYQFKISATVRSSQWLQLLKMGILLMSKSKVLSLKMAKFESSKTKKTGAAGPSQERLAKCDNIFSDFCVYAHSNMQAVFSIMNLLAVPVAGGKNKGQRQRHGEEIKVIFRIRTGSLSHDELALLWRMTDSSFTLSTPEEQAYLDSFQLKDTMETEPSKALVPGKSKGVDSSQQPSQTQGSDCSVTGASTVVSSLGVPNQIKVQTCSQDIGPPAQSSQDYHCRTLSGRSFLALKQLFDSINASEPHLAACLLVRAPTPDTLGRLINATRETSIFRLDFDLSESVYFACKTSSEIKKMLAYLSDYSNSAVIKGDFQLCQRVNV